MKRLGTFALIVGACWIVFALSMDVSVATGSGGRVNNLGLMADRQIYTILGGIIALAGLLMILLRAKPEAASSAAGLDSQLCPFCAETIKKFAIKCKHCGADIKVTELYAAEEKMSGEEAIQPTALANKKWIFWTLCACLIAIIVGGVVIRVLPQTHASPEKPVSASYQPKAEDQAWLDVAAFGCVSSSDFDRAIEHFNRSEYSAFADVTGDDSCFHQTDLDPDTSWTIMQIRGDLMQVGLRHASKYSKDMKLRRYSYWTLVRWASPSRPAHVLGSGKSTKAALIAPGSKSLPVKQSMPVRSTPDATGQIVRRLEPGSIVEVFEIKNGLVRISDNLQTAEWVIPEMLDW